MLNIDLSGDGLNMVSRKTWTRCWLAGVWTCKTAWTYKGLIKRERNDLRWLALICE